MPCTLNDECDAPAFMSERASFSIQHSSFAFMAESRDITAEDARTAAQIEADVGVEHIADVYAKALLDTTERAGQTAAVIEEFDAVVAEVLDRFPKLEAVLASVLVSPEEKSAVIDRVLGGRVSADLGQFPEGRGPARPARLPAGHPPPNARPVRQAAEPHPRAAHHRHAAEPARRPSTSPKASAPSWAANRFSTGDRPEPDRRRRPPHRRHRLRRLDRQPIAQPSSTDDREERHEIQSRRDRFRYPAGN